MKYIVYFSLVALVFTVSETFAQKKKAISFSKEVMPMVEKYCLSCHTTGNENPGSYFMDNYKAVLSEGKHGKAVIAGKGSESNLVNKLKANPPFGEQMPLLNKTKLSDEEINLISGWIDQGARKN